MRKLYFICIGLFSASLLFTQCGGSQDEGESKQFDSVVNAQKTNKVPPEALQKIFKSMPSPVEMTAIIHKSNAKFNEALINPKDNYSKYTSSYKKSLNLGIYGTDLGYMNMYDQTLLSMSYLDAIKSLAEDLKIGQFFNIATIERMVSNKNNIDSLMYLSTASFDKMSTYLNEVNRAHIGALILLGGWIEGLYLSTQTAKQYPSKEMVDRIGEQKIAIEDIMTLLSVYENNSTFKELIADITKIKLLFDKVTITYTAGEPIVEVIDGELVITDTNTSTIEISEDVLKQIIDATEALRNKVILAN